MKMKRIAAASLAVCVTALSGMSAMAARVYTTTTYDYNAVAEATVKVTSEVTDATGSQVTYLVCGTDGGVVDETNILYIDQAASSNAKFEFTTKQADLFGEGVAAIAKFGSNDSADALSDVKFEFNPGMNFNSNGTATVKDVDPFDVSAVLSDWGISDSNYTVYFGKVSGAAKEYGVILKKGDDQYELPAAQCVANDDNTAGIFCVVVTGSKDYNLEGYVKEYAKQGGDLK